MNTRTLILAGAALCAALAASPGALAQAVTDPLQRNAAAVRRIDKAVLLGAALAGQRVVAVGERGIVALSDDHGKTWRQARHVPTSVTLTVVKFVNGLHGWAAGHGGVVLRTSDGGESWTTRLDGVQVAQLMLKRAQAAQQGDSANAANSANSAGTGKAAALLADARRLVRDGADKPFFDLDAVDDQHALVVGAGGLMLATADGGASWAPWDLRIDNPKALNLYSVSRAGRNLLVAGEQGLLAYSRDDGGSFTALKAPYAGSWFTAAFEGPDSFIVAGLRGNAFRGNDGSRWGRIVHLPPLSLAAAVPVSATCTLLANQGGQLFAVEKGQDQALPAPAPPMPPVTTTLRLANGAWLAFTLNGIVQLGQLKNTCSPAVLLDHGKS